MLEYFDKDKRISLYIHIPFCISKCTYCAFYSVPHSLTDNNVKEQYFKRLIKEIEEARKYFNKPFKTIYIGGGTPLLPENLSYIKEILDVSDAKNSNEVTIECNSDNYTENSANVINPYITRLSIGIQTFDNAVLHKFGRKKSEDSDIIRILTLGKDKKINFDFILGIPEYYTTINDIKHLFEICSKNKLKMPEHISAYLLTFEEGTPLRSIIKSLQIDEKCADELKNIWRYLESAGYEHYEVSAFAKDGDINKCEHNINYWTLGDYIGVGASSSSHSTKSFDITYKEDYKAYAYGKIFSGYNVEKLSNKDIASELLLTHLRTTNGLDFSKFFEKTNINFKDVLERTVLNNPFDNISRFVKNNRLILNSDDLLFSDYYIRLLNDNL